VPVHNGSNIPTQVASSFIAIESYTVDGHLIISKHAGERTFIGRVYEMLPLTGGGSEFPTLISGILKDVPDDSLLQFNLICSPDLTLPHDLARGKEHGNETLQTLIGRQALLYEKAIAPGVLLGTPPLNKKTLYASFMVPVAEITDDVITTQKTLQNEFLSGLGNCGFHNLKVLTPQEVVSVYRKFARISEDHAAPLTDEMLDLREQVFTPNNVFDNSKPNYFLIDDKVKCAAVTPKSYPPEINSGIMNYIIGAPLNKGGAKEGGGGTISVPFIISTSIRVADQDKELARIERAISSRKNDKGLPFGLSIGKQRSGDILADLLYVREMCGDESSKIVYTAFTYFLFSEDDEQLDEAVTAVKTKLDNLNFDSQRVRYTTGVRWAQALPLNFSSKIADALCSEVIMPAQSAACLLPIYGDSIGNASRQSNHTGAAFITRRGSAYNFDCFNSKTNKNGIIFAESGAGKSFVTQYLITNALAEGTKTFLFDNGKSAEKFCNSVKGEFIQFSLENARNTSLNPFSGLTQEEFGEQLETITELILKMAYYNEPVGAGARIALGSAVRSAGGDTPSRGSIHKVIEALENAVNTATVGKTASEVMKATTDLIPRLNDFMSAPTRGPFFEGESNFNPQQAFTVFELSSLDGDPHLKQCVLFFVMNTIMNRVKKQSGRKLIMLDEAWQLLKDEGAAASIEAMYRKIRKDDGSVWVITQSIADVAGNASGQVILGQSQWKFIMQQKPEVIAKAIKDGLIVEFTDDAFFIRQLKDVYTEKDVFSEILICGGGSYEAVRLYVDRFTRAVFSSDGDDRDVVFKLMKEGKSTVEAVNIVIGNHEEEKMMWLNSIARTAFAEKYNTKDLLQELGQILRVEA